MGNVMIFQISGFFIINFGIIIKFLMKDCKLNRNSCYHKCINMFKKCFNTFFLKNKQISELNVLDDINKFNPKLDLKDLNV